jgi:hypothetical protein
MPVRENIAMQLLNKSQDSEKPYPNPIKRIALINCCLGEIKLPSIQLLLRFLDALLESRR